MQFTVRPVEPLDIDFLAEMLYEAVAWHPTRNTLEKAILDDPQIARYVRGWGRAGDVGFVAWGEGERLGAAWFRRFSRDAPAFGFVEESIPELSIAVRSASRGRGIGSALIEALFSAARDGGLQALSLSVERENPAVLLYERFGFRISNETDDTLTMVVDVNET